MSALKIDHWISYVKVNSDLGGEKINLTGMDSRESGKRSAGRGGSFKAFKEFRCKGSREMKQQLKGVQRRVFFKMRDLLRHVYMLMRMIL